MFGALKQLPPSGDFWIPSLPEVAWLLLAVASVALLARGVVALNVHINVHKDCGGCAQLSKARSQVKLAALALMALAVLGAVGTVISTVAGQ